MSSIKKIAVTIVFFYWCIAAFAQYGFEFDQKSYAAAKVSMFLLKNESEQIPLSNYHAQDVKHIYHGDLKNFRQTLDLYYPMPHQEFASNHMENRDKGFHILSLIHI